ncbi:MAG: HAD family phosphatase [bacterium]|nr:HAD family phosphatase [bacterium]
MSETWSAVAFDLDGTLVDSLPALRRAYDAFLGAHGAVGSDEEFALLNGPNMAGIVAYLKEAHRLSPPQEELLSAYYGYAEEVYRTEVGPVSGAGALLDWVRDQGMDVALVTSSPRQAVTGVLARLGWTERFRVVVCGDEVPEAKPDPAVYRLACARGEWLPGTSVAIEDAPGGVQAAVGAGMAVIGVARCFGKDELRARGAGWTCASLEEVRGILAERVASDGCRSGR